MKVELISHSSGGEDTIAFAARVCYSQNPEKGKSTEDMIEMLTENHHMSPIEHASYSFYIQGISRCCAQQLTRHRIMSVSMRSQRYVSEAGFEYVIPPMLVGKTVTDPDGLQTSAVDYFEETMAILNERYGVLQKALGGAKESSNEDARYVLPNACTTSLVITLNARSLLHFFEERLCTRSQWEIRSLAGVMLGIVNKVSPNIFIGAGPKCAALGYCPERKSCGLTPVKG